MEDEEHDVGEPLTARGTLGEVIREAAMATGFGTAIKYPTIDTTAGFFRTGQLQDFARNIGAAAAVPSFTSNMARVTDTVAKLGIADRMMKDIGASSAFAKIAAQHQEVAAAITGAMAPVLAPKIDNLNLRDLVSGPRTGDWVQHIPVSPVPALLRELKDEIAQANAAETARADAAEERAEQAERRQRESERRQQKRDRKRDRIEIVMVILTVLSAVAALLALFG